eukprot:3722014-Pyramimonas_sp.AAC.1
MQGEVAPIKLKLEEHTTDLQRLNAQVQSQQRQLEALQSKTNADASTVASSRGTGSGNPGFQFQSTRGEFGLK